MHNGPRSRNRCSHGLTRASRGWSRQETLIPVGQGVESRREIEAIDSLIRMTGNLFRNTDERKTLPERGLARDNLVAVVDAGKCTLCGRCAEICPSGAVTVDSMVSIETGKCLECGKCVSECQQGAITIKRI